MSYQEDKDIPERLKKMWDTDPSVEDRDRDVLMVPLLLDRLRELRVVQEWNKWECVFFFPVHNVRPLLMFQRGELDLPQFERLQPFHVFETVNHLMWAHLLEPELALSYRGLFDYGFMSQNCFYLSACPSDSASNYMCEWLMP
jgi:hypothetical protein